MKTAQELFRQEALQWVYDARMAAIALLEDNETITIEDVLNVCPRPKYINRNLTGSVFKSDEFESVGYTKAKKPSSNGRVIRLWARRVV